MPLPDHIARMRAALTARRIERAANARYCTAIVEGKEGPHLCGAQMTQNEVERGRGTYWCPACQRYTDGSNGYGAGEGPLHGLRKAPESISRRMLQARKPDRPIRGTSA